MRLLYKHLIDLDPDRRVLDKCDLIRLNELNDTVDSPRHCSSIIVASSLNLSTYSMLSLFEFALYGLCKDFAQREDFKRKFNHELRLLRKRKRAQLRDKIYSIFKVTLAALLIASLVSLILYKMYQEIKGININISFL